jgi:UPF0755 protein
LRRSGKKRDRDDIEDRLDALRPVGSKRRGRRRSGIGAVIFGALLLLGILGAVYVLVTTSFGEEPEAPVEVVVEEGDTLSTVAGKLEEAGVIESAAFFKLEARVKGQGTEIKAGEYRIRPGEDSEEILATLTSGEETATVTITVPEGLTIEQTAQVVAEQSDIEAGDFKEAARETGYPYAFLEDPAVETTEGFLFPKQYEFEEGIDARQVVRRQLEQYLIETQNLDFKSAGERLNLSEYELLTVASLIERESANAEERPLVASVIYNRLREDMPLQIDATIQYARGEPKENLSLEDLEVDSPYNTYKNTGLPPGPIASPSLDSIEAALNPAKTDYLYYVLTADGESHHFTDDYDDFLEAKEEAGR